MSRFSLADRISAFHRLFIILLLLLELLSPDFVIDSLDRVYRPLAVSAKLHVFSDIRGPSHSPISFCFALLRWAGRKESKGKEMQVLR